jgi:hypothetical protein
MQNASPDTKGITHHSAGPFNEKIKKEEAPI